MRIYLIHTSSGMWDDYSSWVDAVFVDAENAEKYCLRKNRQLDNLKRMIEDGREKFGEDLFDEMNKDRLYYEIMDHGIYSTKVMDTKD